MKRTVTKMIESICLPQALDFWFKQLNINYQTHTPTVKVVSKTIINDVVKLVLKPSKAFGEFVAGQHVRLKLEINGIGEERCYSIANLPNRAGLVELFIKVQGQVSQSIKETVKKGLVLDISKPFGQNHQQSFDTFIAGGIGITAMWPLFKASNNKDAKLLYLTRINNGSQSAALLKEIKASKFYKNGQVVIENGRSFLSDSANIGEFLEGAKKAISCGSEGFNEVINTQVYLVKPDISLSFESFKSTNAAPVKHEIKTDIQVKLINSDKTIVVDNKTSLLDSLLNAGIKAKHGCKQGICHECTCRVSAASLLNDVNKTIQLCTTFPSTDLELEL
ncbi:flavin reductase family protein [Psychrosphaera aestuarii]|uniref:flavin reductase family protein n=1 Tax=Psychrosphaera aestuarii TaxID=1266052 RepID=UPI001B32B664|nr:FAD-binding oxidoreductase [Psychrosphaera aestuarii]